PHSIRRSFQILCPYFFTAPPTTDIYTLSLHDALPISAGKSIEGRDVGVLRITGADRAPWGKPVFLFMGCHHAREWISVEVPLARSEEHTSELQSLRHLVCRLLLEKKKKKKNKMKVLKK